MKGIESYVQHSNKNSGTLVISLDFELYWGVRDQLTKKAYGENILGVQSAIPALLQTFKQYNIHATWAIVGFLFFNNKQELISDLPIKLPNYTKKKLSPYPYLDDLHSSKDKDLLHFSPSLINLIASCPFQEIGTHTFSHYYCLEHGQTKVEFEHDLRKAISIAECFGIQIKSLVFPRNQVNLDYLSVCRKLGITSYRGNEQSWIYQTKRGDERRILKRFLRLLDAYMNISGYNSYQVYALGNELPFNQPSSRFLRPYSKRLKWLEAWRLRRILSELTYAAKHSEIYHLWWHPHNFGTHLNENIKFLKKVLDHYSKLQKKYGMKSMNMGELTRKYKEEFRGSCSMEKGFP